MLQHMLPVFVLTPQIGNRTRGSEWPDHHMLLQHSLTLQSPSLGCTLISNSFQVGVLLKDTGSFAFLGLLDMMCMLIKMFSSQFMLEKSIPLDLSLAIISLDKPALACFSVIQKSVLLFQGIHVVYNDIFVYVTICYCLSTHSRKREATFMLFLKYLQSLAQCLALKSINCMSKEMERRREK